MLVFVDENLEDLKNYLRQEGYSVTSDRTSYVDVYIYSGSRSQGLLSSSINANDGGCLMVNADGMPVEEVIHILNHRTYTPLI